MLIRALTDEFKRYFTQADHHDTVLWFDSEEEYTALLDHLTEVPLMGAKEGREVGMAFFVAMVGALLNKPVMESLVFLGEMSLRGGLQPVGSLTERLQLAMDNRARRVLLPLENKRDFLDVPGDVLDKLQIIFYSDPSNAAFRAMGLE